MKLPTIKLKKWQRIFVNRSLNMSSIKAIGFDMDHTLATYNSINFETLAFKVTLDKFIKAGYPKELAKLKFDVNSVIRGLLVDRERGNLLKVDCYKYVKHAYHGKRQLKKDERHKLYNSQSYKADTFLSVDTFFALSEVHLFAEIVDFMSKNPGRIKKDFREVYADLRKFIDLSHQDGSIKNEVLRNPAKFIDRDPQLPKALSRMIEGGKSLFLLTNSNYEYTNMVMTYLLQHADSPYQRWQDYFDTIIVSAGKPDFFVGKKTFVEIDPKKSDTRKHKGALRRGAIYSGGNAESLQALTGFRGDEILYVGDHVYGDIITSKDRLNWRTMLVVPELTKELPLIEKNTHVVHEIERLQLEREVLDEKLQILRNRLSAANDQLQLAHSDNKIKRVKILAREVDKLSGKLQDKDKTLQALDEQIRRLIKEREQAIHPVWGELMKVGMEKSRFAQQVEQYACLYTGTVTNIRFYSPFKRFTSNRDLLPHDQGN